MLVKRLILFTYIAVLGIIFSKLGKNPLKSPLILSSFIILNDVCIIERY